MREICYNHAGYSMKFGYPPGWDASTIAEVRITVTDKGGTSLLAATAATVFTANQLNAAVTAGGTSLTLKTAIGGGTSSPAPGDKFLIAASASGPSEIIECKYYDSTNKIIYPREDFYYSHAINTYIYGMQCYYSIVTTTTATFTKGLQMVLNWQPTTSASTHAAAYPAAYEMAEIAAAEYQGGALEPRFKLLYPREYNQIVAYGGTFNDYYNEAKAHLTVELLALGLVLERVVDQERVNPSLLALTRYLVDLAGGDDWQTERDTALAEYVRQFEIPKSDALWTDLNQDGIQDDSELDSYQDTSLLGSERIL